MALPSSWGTVRVYGTYTLRDGDPAVGTIVFHSPQIVVADGVTIVPRNIVCELDEDGFFEYDLPSTDDTDIAPDGWTYTVRERIDGGGGRAAYAISVPLAGGDINLATVAPAVAVDEQSTLELWQLADVDDDAEDPIEGYALCWNDTTKKWEPRAGVGGSASWGAITGTLSAQTDLQSALDAKATTAAIATKLDDLSAGTADAIVTASADGTLLSRAAYTIATLIAHVVARAQHTGTQLASTISDFASAAIAAVTWSTLTGKPSTFDPSAHKTSHATGGSDALTASDIGAATAGHDHTGVYQPLATVLTNTTAAFTTAQETKLSGIEAAADVTDAGNVGTAIDGATAKTTPADADTVPLIDSAAANVLKKLSWTNIKATLKTYFDTLYQAVLVSGTNIKTVNSTSLLGSGDIAIGGLTGFTAADNTASPNATVPVASLTANNAATNVDAALRPKGTGAVLAHVPDSTTAGGNKRGIYAVDWQMLRAAATQVASGAYAFIGAGYYNRAAGNMSVIAGGDSNQATASQSTIGGGTSNQATAQYSSVTGGNSNTASGTAAAVAGGQENTASGTNSWCPGGRYATTRGVQSAGAYSGTLRAALGDRQTMLLPIACAARTDATPTIMTSDAGTASAANQMVLPNNSSMFFEVDAVAHDSSLKSASWKVQGTIRRGANAAATTIVGTNVTTTFGSDLSGGSPGVTCTADTTNGALQVTFTGIAATTIYPSGHIRTVIAA